MVVFEPFVFMVSLVLKLWHLLLGKALGLSPSVAWTLSIILLVITVRGLIFYFSFQQFVSGRKMANLRPKFKALSEKYKTSGDPDAPRFVKWGSAELRQQEGINTFGMVAPIFIQIPVIYGLVLLVRGMLRAASSPGAPAAHGVGLLSTDEVTSFLSASLFDLPLPAYLAMRPQQYAALGVTPDEMLRFCIPAVFAAASFTGINLIISSLRIRKTLDYSQKFSQRIYKFIVAMIFVSPLMILFFGFVGPSAVALILYWVSNNLWTLVQSLFLTVYVERKYPLSAEFISIQSEDKNYLTQEIKLRKALKQLRRKAMRYSAIHPGQALKVRKKYKETAENAHNQLHASRNSDPELELKVAQYRYIVGQMRPANQDNLPSLTSEREVRINENTQVHIEKPKPKFQWMRKLPKPIMIIVWFGYQSGIGARNIWLKAIGKSPSPWKRFRD